MKDLFQNEVSNEEIKLLIAAYRQAILFTEEKDIPQKFKNSSEKSKKINGNVLTTIRFIKNVDKWKNVFSKILERVEIERKTTNCQQANE